VSCGSKIENRWKKETRRRSKTSIENGLTEELYLCFQDSPILWQLATSITWLEKSMSQTSLAVSVRFETLFLRPFESGWYWRPNEGGKTGQMKIQNRNATYVSLQLSGLICLPGELFVGSLIRQRNLFGPLGIGTES
jgi:hypothetical protein